MVPNRGLMEFSVIAAAEMGRSHSGRESQPGKWLELVVEEEGFQSAGCVITFSKRRRAAAVVENDPKELAVILVKAVEAGLQAVLGDVGAKTHLSTRVG